MYAVIRTGGKQYRVAKNDVITIEKLVAEKGATVSFDEVLMVGGDGTAKVGAPLVAGAKVTGTVLDQGKGEKSINATVTRTYELQAYQGGKVQDTSRVVVTVVDDTGVQIPLSANFTGTTWQGYADARLFSPDLLIKSIAFGVPNPSYNDWNATKTGQNGGAVQWAGTLVKNNPSPVPGAVPFVGYYNLVPMTAPEIRQDFIQLYIQAYCPKRP